MDFLYRHAAGGREQLLGPRPDRTSCPRPRSMMKNPSSVALRNRRLAKAGKCSRGRPHQRPEAEERRQRRQQHGQLEDDRDIGRQAPVGLAAEDQRDSRPARRPRRWPCAASCSTTASPGRSAPPISPPPSTSQGRMRRPDAHRPVQPVDGEGAVAVPPLVAGLADPSRPPPAAQSASRYSASRPQRDEGSMG